MNILAAVIIHVLIIDTGTTYLPEYTPWLHSWEVDKHGHGTSITSLVLFGDDLKDKPCSNVEVDVCKGLDDGKLPQDCFAKAADGYYDYINVSGGGVAYSEDEAIQVKRLTETGSIIIAAAGNNNIKLNDKGTFYPASFVQGDYINIRAVGNGDNEEEKAPSSNYGDKLTWLSGQSVTVLNRKDKKLKINGTSASAALLTHKYIMERCKE